MTDRGVSSPSASLPPAVLSTNLPGSPSSPYLPSSATSPAPRATVPMIVPTVVANTPTPPSPEDLQWAAQRQLVQNAAYVDYTIQQDDRAREASAYGGYGGSSRSVSGGYSVQNPTAARAFSSPMPDSTSASATAL
jgi:hypothetical protein